MIIFMYTMHVCAGINRKQVVFAAVSYSCGIISIVAIPTGKENIEMNKIEMNVIYNNGINLTGKIRESNGKN